MLQPQEYDQHYYDGFEYPPMHPAGYSDYSLPHQWNERVQEIFSRYNFSTKKLLDVGCAKGYLVQQLRSLGVNAYGIDVSAYAIGCADESIKSYLTVADARTYLATIARNEYDIVISTRLFCCFTDQEIVSLITQMNRITRQQQVHIVDENPNPLYYNGKALNDWKAFGFAKGTILVSNETGKYVTK